MFGQEQRTETNGHFVFRPIRSTQAPISLRPLRTQKVCGKSDVIRIRTRNLDGDETTSRQRDQLTCLKWACTKWDVDEVTGQQTG